MLKAVGKRQLQTKWSRLPDYTKLSNPQNPNIFAWCFKSAALQFSWWISGLSKREACEKYKLGLAHEPVCLSCKSSQPSLLSPRFLTYCPAKRISADEALKHEYFRETPLPIEPSMFPTWPAKSEQQRVKRGTSPRPPEGGLGYSQLVGDTTVQLPVFCLESLLYMWNPRYHLYSIVWHWSLGISPWIQTVQAKTTKFNVLWLNKCQEGMIWVLFQRVQF